jgi:hypothetical protein
MGIFSTVKAMVEDRGPTEAQQLTMVKILSVVSWADGVLVDAEVAMVTTALAELGGVHPSKAKEILQNVRQFDETLKAELMALPPEMAHAAMKLAFRVANADDEITDSELEAIRKIAECILPGKDWALVRTWITSQDGFLKATRKLFS